MNPLVCLLVGGPVSRSQFPIRPGKLHFHAPIEALGQTLSELTNIKERGHLNVRIFLSKPMFTFISLSK